MLITNKLNINANNHQRGLTLVELLIGMLVGIIVVGGGITVFTNSVKDQADNISLTRLNQDLRSMMDIMVRDIRRAGYVTSDPDTHFLSLQNNPFFETDSADITLYDTNGTGSCIVYSYNRDESDDNDDDESSGAGDGRIDVETRERLGFRFAADGDFDMRKSGTTNTNCTNGSWETITSPYVQITNLTFTLTTSSLNVTSMINDDDGDGTVESTDTDGVPYGDDDLDGLCDPGEVCDNCTNDGSSGAPACLFVRNVTISLTGNLVADNTVSQTITEWIRIRNDKFVDAIP